MKVGEVWIMKQKAFEYHDSFYSDADKLEDTKVRIMVILDDIVSYMYLYSSEVDMTSRRKFLENYEKIY